MVTENKPTEESGKPKESKDQHIRGPHRGVVHPFYSQPQVGTLMGPKPMAGEDQTRFFPDDRKHLNLRNCMLC